jgi:cathepsin B
MTLEEAKRLLGTVVIPGKLREFPVRNRVMANLPTTFDSRQQWPGAIHPIRDQQQCGSCWAFACSEVASDRFAIKSNLSINVVLSPQDLVSCDNQDGNMGCNGGYPIKAMQYVVSNGLVADACYPYTSGGGDTGDCELKGAGSTCPSGSGTVKFYKNKNAYQVADNEAAIQTEILNNGPVEAAFNVYEDFFSYKGGVYKHTKGGLAGGHAVKIIGWGVLNNEKYWLVANSWNTSWGLDGFFMILRGVDECGIESGIVAGEPNV